MSLDLLSMPWLPRAGAETRTALRDLRKASTFNAELAGQLARTALDLNQLHRLASCIPQSSDNSSDRQLTLSILSNATTDFIAPAVAGTALRYGFALNTRTSGFGSFAMEALNPESATNRRENDFTLLALDHRALGLIPCPGARENAEALVEQAMADITRFSAALIANGSNAVILQTIPAPHCTLFGSLDAQLPGTLFWLTEAFNERLRRASLPGTHVLDCAQLAAQIGLSEWTDEAAWNLGKFPFAQRAVPLYADWLLRLIAACQGKSRKCLVLDLDNTLWGGVIGDDGLEGVVLAQGNPVGEAFLSVQKTALALRERGIILAVSSKNNDETARSMFRQHPEMILKEEHIAVFQANWQDKASNLRAIANTLDIGIDSLVLLDDNPAERAQVRAELPEVGVPELPAEPEFYARTLLAAGYFEAAQFTSDDKQRADQYSANAARKAALGEGSDMAQYLASLEMRAHVSPFNKIGRARITQLINKTNQFNLTTRRYSETEVIEFEQNTDIVDLQIRLEDKFGDNGMICVIIGRVQDSVLDIDTWLMSCRVLNRRVEEMVLNVLLDIAQARNIKSIEGTYIATDRNAIVADLFERLGFSAAQDAAEGERWTLQVNDSRSEVPIEVTCDNIPLAAQQ